MTRHSEPSTEAHLKDSPENCPQPGDRVKIRCDTCMGRGTTYEWIKAKFAYGWGEFKTETREIAVKCKPCAGNGFTTGALK